MKHIRWLPVLLGVTILGITAFQVYWLRNTYEREKRTLDMRTNMLFRETLYALQAAKIDVDKLGADSLEKTIKQHKQAKTPAGGNQKMAGLVHVLREKLRGMARHESIDAQRGDTPNRRLHRPRHDKLIRFLYEIDSTQDSIRLAEVVPALRQRLQQQHMNVPFVVNRLQQPAREGRVFREVTLGFVHPVTYQLRLGNTTPYLMRRILAPIFLSVFLVGFTLLSFVLLYRNLLRQRRLATIKNDFISNITHELKTPIATVSVAIEALRSFNAQLDAQRTKEYLDISHNELQRLSLLVDKVLKLSLFEKKELELRYEPLDLNSLVAEVVASMRLQSEKYGAQVTTCTEGDTSLEGDRLHLVSVIFNLLDNALKYGSSEPRIAINTRGSAGHVTLTITDNGIGIPAEYRDKVFEKFFRVPTGNVHNAKGYGLGLSYVAHVVRKHRGRIALEPAARGGSRFVVSLPKHPA